MKHERLQDRLQKYIPAHDYCYGAVPFNKEGYNSIDRVLNPHSNALIQMIMFALTLYEIIYIPIRYGWKLLQQATRL